MDYHPPQYNALCAPIDHLEPIGNALPEHASRSLKLTMQALAAVNHMSVMLHNSRIEATHHDNAQRLNPACEMSLLGGIAAMATLLGEELERVLVGTRSPTAE